MRSKQFKVIELTNNKDYSYIYSYNQLVNYLVNYAWLPLKELNYIRQYNYTSFTSIYGVKVAIEIMKG